MSNSETFPVPAEEPDKPIASAAKPNEEEKARAEAAKDFFALQRTVQIGRAVFAGLAAVLGLVICLTTACVAWGSVNDAWSERTVYGAKGYEERVKYLLAFFTFKAAALGGALTGGLFLLRTANRLSGGVEEKEKALEVKLPGAGGG